jgi:AcrR family transcriptional regulator
VSPTAKVRSSDTRERILDHALKLWARNGVGNTSMRSLADACDLNVAALYHYFDSKAALLGAVIDERQYGALLDQTTAPPAADPTAAVAEMIALLFEGAVDEGRIWRLLVAESCRDNRDAQLVGVSLVGALESTIGRWLEELDVQTRIERTSAAGLVAAQLIALLVADVLEPGAVTVETARSRGLELARCVVA